jgi:predicted transglutaminase-like cysteine proteinase
MRLSIYAHAWRAALLVCSMVWFGPSAFADPLAVPASLKLTVESGEPFGLYTAPVYAGGLLAKWLGVEKKLDDERVQLALCDGDRENCASDAALKFLSIVDAGREHTGRARLGEINRAINLAIHPMSDLAQYGQIDVWSSPLVTFTHAAGDCEDYAIAKYVALRLAGIAADDLRLVVLHDTIRGEDHAVAAARLDGHWLMLDNKRMTMVEDADVRNYRPLFVLDERGVMRYGEPPLMAALPQPDPALLALNVTGEPAPASQPN